MDDKDDKEEEEDPFVFAFEIPFNMMLAGHTGSGKTTLMRRILKQVWTEFTYVFLMSRTLRLNDDYKEFPENKNAALLPFVKHFPDEFAHETKKIIDRQSDLIEESREDAPDILIVYEDQANTQLTQFRGMLDQFALVARHHKISMIFSTQRITAIGRTIRLNTKYFILFPQSNFTEMEQFLEECIPSKYRKLLRDHVEDIFFKKYIFLLVDCFNAILRDRLWINGKLNALDYIEFLDQIQEDEDAEEEDPHSLTINH